MYDNMSSMSEEELFEKVALINSKIALAFASQSNVDLIHQMQDIAQSYQDEITERQLKAMNEEGIKNVIESDPMFLPKKEEAANKEKIKRRNRRRTLP